MLKGTTIKAALYRPTIKGIGGWAAKVMSVARDKQQTTAIAFKDADGRRKEMHTPAERAKNGCYHATLRRKVA